MGAEAPGAPEAAEQAPLYESRKQRSKRRSTRTGLRSIPADAIWSRTGGLLVAALGDAPVLRAAVPGDIPFAQHMSLATDHGDGAEHAVNRTTAGRAVHQGRLVAALEPLEALAQVRAGEAA